MPQACKRWVFLQKYALAFLRCILRYQTAQIGLDQQPETEFKIQAQSHRIDVWHIGLKIKFTFTPRFKANRFL